MNWSRVTLGITCFNRPHLVRRLLESIQQHAPQGVRIDIAENGIEGPWDHTLVKSEEGRRIFLLPFDAGCAATRNELAKRFVGDYLVYLEEDFVFTEKTDLRPLVEILDFDSRVGVVGGFVDPGYFPPVLEERSLPSGLQYYKSSTARMFVMCRREILEDHPFDEMLKTGEHGPWMTVIGETGKWDIAFCGQTSIFHHNPEPDSDWYRQYRGRAKKLKQEWWEKHKKTALHKASMERGGAE